jgi:hypothetical protein
MATTNESKGPLAFPHHLGPGTRDLTPVLLFHERMAVTMPGWLAPGVLATFFTVGEYASVHQHRLSPVFNMANHYLELAQKQAIAALDAFEPLGSRIARVLAVYPGDSNAYAKWDPLLDRCLPIAVALLREPLHCCTASVEFAWRVWETSLELGADPDDPTAARPDAILQALDARAHRLGDDPLLLLAESGMNRYCMPRSGAGSYATASASAVSMLAAIGADMTGDVANEDISVRREALAFFLFEQVAQPFLKPLTPSTASMIADLMAQHVEPLSRMRRKCEQEALVLLSDRTLDPRLLSSAVSTSVETMEDEAQAIAGLDQKSMRSYVSTISENPTVWATVSGLVASAAALPEVVTASLAITAFSLLGATAVKASRERRESLQKSPWAFLYHAKAKL